MARILEDLTKPGNEEQNYSQHHDHGSFSNGYSASYMPIRLKRAHALAGSQRLAQCRMLIVD